MSERTMVCPDDVCRSAGECAWGERPSCFVEDTCPKCGQLEGECVCDYEDADDLMGIDINGFKTLGYS